jgi:hypothetical protein
MLVRWKSAVNQARTPHVIVKVTGSTDCIPAVPTVDGIAAHNARSILGANNEGNDLNFLGSAPYWSLRLAVVSE